MPKHCLSKYKDSGSHPKTKYKRLVRVAAAVFVLLYLY